MVYKRKKYHYGDTHLKRRWQTKRRTKDLDQIDEDLKPENSSQLLRQDVDFDKPGGAQYYCLHCARHFINSTALQDHFKTKVHKRRLKALEIEPYTIEESERAAGFGNWKTANKRKIETQPQTTEDESEDSPNKKMKIDEKRNFSSALYITGDKAQKTFSVLTPVIDFEKQLQNKDILVKNVNDRGLPIDIRQIEKRWQFFQSVTDQKKVLESARMEIGRLISALMENSDENKDEIEKLKLHSKLVKEDLKNLKDFYYGLEEGTMLQILNLPNILHEKTSIDSVTLHSFLEILKEKSESHMEIGEKIGFIEYVNPLTCYFKSDAALYEIGMLNYFRQCLLDLKYVQFSNSNFCRSIIIEGCGDNYEESLKVFTLEEQDSKDDINRLHLCGAASLYPFMAYFTRHSVQQTQFPLKYFSLGKKYHPFNSELPNNLFNLSQEAALNIFIATLEEVDILEEITKEVTTLYESLGYHFKLIILPARELDKSESLRLSVQMYSNYLERYVEVGNVSLYDSYLSKRLLFTYSAGKERKYPKVIAGTLLNIPRLLGCVLENNFIANQDLKTDLVRKHMFV